MSTSRTIAHALAVAPVALCLLAFASPLHAAQTGVSGSQAAQTGVSGSGQAQTGVSGGGLTNPLKDSDLVSLLNDLLNFAITIGGIAIVLMLVFVGFKFVAAQGNDSKLTEARTMLFWTVVGALILLGAKAIEAGVQATVQSISS
jgi:hypothetical protein